MMEMRVSKVCQATKVRIASVVYIGCALSSCIDTATTLKGSERDLPLKGPPRSVFRKLDVLIGFEIAGSAGAHFRGEGARGGGVRLQTTGMGLGRVSIDAVVAVACGGRDHA